MTAAEEDTSETSPLLANGSGRKPSIGDEVSVVVTAGVDVEGADLERRDSVDESRAAQFQGLPEMQKKLKIILPAVAIGVFLSAADQTIIASSYGKIGSDLNALNLTSWVATSYFLTLTSFQPLYGKLSDIFGRKSCLLFSYAIFGLGNLGCGLAQDINQLIAARIFQGIGGGGMTTVVSIILSDIVALKDRGVWQGILNIIYASGAAAGAPLGGVLADGIGWRWTFLGQAPLCLLAFITVAVLLQIPGREQKHWKSNLRRIDFLGALVLVCAVFGMLLGLDRGSNVSWDIPLCYGPLIASVLLFGIFVYVETKIAKEPFAPGHIIFNKTLFACYMCNFFSFGGWLAAIYYLPLFYQAVDGLSATGAAIRLLPAISCGVSGSLFAGFYMKRVERYYWLTVVAYTMLFVGLLDMVLFEGIIGKSTWLISIGTMFCAFGNGIGVTTTLIALIANAQPEDQAVTTACSYLFRSLGSVIGIALSATTVQQSLRNQLRESLSSDKDANKIVEGVRRSLDYLKTLNPEVAAIVRKCYGHAIRDGFMLMVVIAFFAMVSSFFLKEKRLSK